MRDITILRRLKAWDMTDSFTVGEHRKLARFESRADKRRAWVDTQCLMHERDVQRQRREERQAEAERKHQQAAEAAARIHRAAS